MNLKGFIIMVLLLVAVSFAPAAGAGMPGDENGDSVLSRQEVSENILRFLACDAGEECTQVLDEKEILDIIYIYSVWGGRPKEITDSAGNKHTLVSPLHSVVVMNGETLETMRSLGVSSSTVTAVDKYTPQKPEFFPEYAATPSVGSIWAPDYERILAARPDAVFLYATVSTKECDEIEQRITAADPAITVFRIDCYHPETYLDDVKILGEIFDRQEDSIRLTAFYTSILDTLDETLSTADPGSRPQVYFETWTDYKTAGPGSGYHDKIELAGGDNIFSDSAAEYPEIDPEAVIERQPEVIVKLVGTGKYTFGGYSGINATEFATVRDALVYRPGWNTLSAVRDDRVYVLHNGIVGGPQYIIGEAYLAKWFHPALFAGLPPEELHRTYLRDFQGLDAAKADPSQFVYPVGS
jgi:iron complex transport system substrate-binding protein